ncbi:protein phosphatase [Amphibacillus marinus]|uniref:protein-serine/threonine phosphatase n=1 Tax=Amphibacillus marinus TaxID=872970 RepID=A0A1H8HYI4_9BACI|nr:Stp1/IreP family PP2C-type Ser/Thr phosphatase [Amphibacillus marinus]SEN61127.1 protein phosphatase [Amphibacillus marinus]
MKRFFVTDQGKVREHNEDAGGIFVNQAGQILSVVADGMGGHQAGEVASKMVKEYFLQEWKKVSQINDSVEAEAWLSEHIKVINGQVFQHAEENIECKGMGTTVIAVIFLDEHLSIAHIGDSRCYRFQDGQLEQVTDDHSFVNELVRSGQLSKEDAELHPRKNVLMRALGTNAFVDADIFSTSWHSGTRLLICSDGLTDKLSDQDLIDQLALTVPLKTIAETMVSLANQRGGEDNITLALLEHEEMKAGDPDC